jgi:putative acyl-CoA dehydrogenase
MVNHPRLDCVIGGATGMRAGVAQAIHHASHRSVFGRQLSEQPLMQNVLADLAVESEAATISAMRLARAYDEAIAGDTEAQSLKRVANAVLKYWITKRAPAHAGECLECLGGNGYVEESGMPLLFRESPLNSIWEGSGNVNALDVLRALGREPEVLEAWLTEVGLAQGEDPRLDRAIEGVLTMLADTTTLEVSARRLAGQMAACLQASLLVRFAPPAIADAFCATRLGGDYNGTLGTLPVGTDLRSIVERTTPVVA